MSSLLVLAGLWIAICVYASVQWYKVRRRAIAVRLDFRLTPNTHPDNLVLADARVTAPTFWVAAGAFGALVGVLAIMDWGPGLQTLLMFAGPVILAAMGHEQNRLELALMVRDSAEANTIEALEGITAQLQSSDDETSLRAVADRAALMLNDLASTLARLEKMLKRMEAGDVIIAADLKVAQRAVDEIKEDTDESRKRADAVGDAPPGEAADAWSQSGDD